MSNEPGSWDPCSIWQEEGAARLVISPDEMRRKAARMERRTRYTMWVLVGVLSGGAVMFLRMGLGTRDPFQRVGGLLLFAGLLYFVFQAWRMAAETRALRIATQAAPSVDFLSGMLELIRDYSSGPSFWARWVAYFPGALLLTYGAAITSGGSALERYLPFGTIAFACVASIPLAIIARRRTQERIDRLYPAEADE